MLDNLKQTIQQNGPIPLDHFMGKAIAHYYTHHHAIGAQGDFTTAPEISQIFGEMAGLWVIFHWMQMGHPSDFILCECGPGRGTLMADIARTIKNTPDCAKAAQIHLVEISPKMRSLQKQRINHASPVIWHDDFNQLPQGMPILLLANEFLDALPIQQFQKTASGWAQRMVGLDDAGELALGLAPCPALPFDDADEGQVVELSPARIAYCRALKSRLLADTGAALLIDYGYHVPPLGETLQALHNKAPCGVLQHVGAADLTAHVDFHSITKLFSDMAHILTNQAAWLTGMDAPTRLETLIAGNPAHEATLREGYNRLTAPDQMGELFKVLEIRSYS